MNLDLLLLDEPVVVEFTNSLYINGDDRYDLLVEEPTAWLGAVGLPVLDGAELVRLQALRDAVRCLVVAQVDGLSVDSDALALVNDVLGNAPTSKALVWQNGTWITVPRAPTDAAGLFGMLAEATVELLTHQAGRLHRCAAADCPLVFLQRHRRRRFCHPTCSGRMRQAAYLRRQRDV